MVAGFLLTESALCNSLVSSWLLAFLLPFEREREAERERETERDRETEIQTERDRETERDRDRQTEREGSRRI